MTVDEWQTRLEKVISDDPGLSAILADVLEHENAYGQTIADKFRGHHALMTTFTAFWAKTLFLAARQKPPENPRFKGENYLQVHAQFTANFRRFRAAEHLLYCGYPLFGYALLRDIKDSSTFLAALIQGMTTSRALRGLPAEELPAEQIEAQKEIIRRRKVHEENRVLREMLQLMPAHDQELHGALETWKALFHLEVHGSQLTISSELLDWMKGSEPFSVGPTSVERSSPMYMNRASEIGWIVLRVLPYLQLKAGAFGAEWTKQWNILDESFRFMVMAMDRIGKPIGRAFCALIDLRYQFDTSLIYSASADEMPVI
jgi:hypothetical protein